MDHNQLTAALAADLTDTAAQDAALKFAARAGLLSDIGEYVALRGVLEALAGIEIEPGAPTNGRIRACIRPHRQAWSELYEALDAARWDAEDAGDLVLWLAIDEVLRAVQPIQSLVEELRSPRPRVTHEHLPAAARKALATITAKGL